MAHGIICDTSSDESGCGHIFCLHGTPATTYVVWRWAGEDTYHHANQCDACAEDIRFAGQLGEAVIVWMASIDDDGLVFSLPDRVEAL